MPLQEIKIKGNNFIDVSQISLILVKFTLRTDTKGNKKKWEPNYLYCPKF